MADLELTEINEKLAGLETTGSPPGEIRIDAHHRTFIEFQETFEWPSVTITGILPEEKKKIVDTAARFIPDFMAGCHILPESRPRKESSQAHLARAYRVENSNYLYILKIFGEYLGGAREDELLEPASQGRSPVVKTDRIYFSARLLPVTDIIRENGQIVDFHSRHIEEALFQVSKMSTATELEKRELFTTMVFDDVDYSLLDKKFSEIFAMDSTWSGGKTIRPLLVEYLTLCLNLPFPYRALVDVCAEYFHVALESFLKTGYLAGLRENEKQFWNEYYASWKFGFSSSRRGNAQWKMEEYPPAEWASRMKALFEKNRSAKAEEEKPGGGSEPPAGSRLRLDENGNFQLH